MARKFSVSTVSSSSPVASLEPVHSKLHYSIQAAVVKVTSDHPVYLSPISSDLSAFGRLRLPILKTRASPGFLDTSHSQHLSLSPATPLRPSLLIPSQFLTLKHWPQHPDHFCFQLCSALSGLMESPGAHCHLFDCLSSDCHDKIP